MICDTCSREMTLGVACVDPEYLIGGQVYPRVPAGDHECHDCLAPAGALHHPGCCEERCPVCRGQVISCGCGETLEDGEWL